MDQYETAPQQPVAGQNKPSALYRCYDELGRLLYVGITNAGAGRWIKHGHESAWWELTRRIDLEHYPTRADACAAERQIIRELQPMHNTQHADYGKHSAGTDGCVGQMRWVDLTNPEAWFQYEGRWYAGAWLCENCHDYDPYVAPPLSAARPDTPPEHGRDLQAEHRAAIERIKEASRRVCA